jgi:hypothetical protein
MRRREFIAGIGVAGDARVQQAAMPAIAQRSPRDAFPCAARTSTRLVSHCAARSGASSIHTVPGRGYRFTLRVMAGDTVGRDGDLGTNKKISAPIHAPGPAFDTHEPIASKSTALEQRVVAPRRTWPIDSHGGVYCCAYLSRLSPAPPTEAPPETLEQLRARVHALLLRRSG